MSDVRYEQLDPVRIVATVERLSRRVAERFPDSGLRLVSEKLAEISRKASERAASFGRPIVWVRVLSAVVISALVLLLVGALYTAITAEEWKLSIAEIIQVAEAGLNELVAIGITVFFVVSLESRIKRRRALEAVHEIRVISHIIDMHQLTKDPDRIHSSRADTASSPARTLTPFELQRYLDYCSEMLSLAGKIAVLYVQTFPDSQTVGAVNDVEDLTSGLARKIWQKIMILNESGIVSDPADAS